MTTKRGIFGGQRRGIDLNSGRKANILASMARKAQQSLMSIDKAEVTPFSGHSLASSSATSLATSQVTEGQAGLFDGELLRQIAREEAERLLKQHMMSRDKSLTEGINTLSRNLEAVQRNFHMALQTKIEQLRKDVALTQEEHEENTNNGLKKLMELINRRITDLEKLSLKTNFADDMFQQIEALHDRLDSVEQQKPSLDTSMVKREAQSVVSREIEVNFTKSMREVESLKKLVQSMNEERQKVNSEVVDLNKTIAELTVRHEKNESKVEQLRSRSREEQLQRELQKIKQQLEENTSRINKGLEKLESVELQKVLSSESKELEPSRNQEPTASMDIPLTKTVTSSLTSGINEPTVTSIIMGSRQPPEITSQISAEVVSQNIETQLLTRHNSEGSQPQSEQLQRPNQIYQIDHDGYLQDEFGQFILDQDNKFIVLSPEQIEALRDSKILME